MRETSKANLRRRGESFWKGVFKGSGIDIGSGSDPLKSSTFEGVTSVLAFDRIDGDAQSITGRVKDQFDFVYSSNCMEHLSDPKEALKKWWSLVKPGGHLVFTVPDEDLYEQGTWPSRWNPDHHWTFTIWKKKSWSPNSINVAELVSELDDYHVLRMQLVDTGYDHDLPDVDQSLLGAETSIEVVLRKKGASAPEPGTFKHSGARGDIVYSLPTIRALGGGKLYLLRESGAYISAPLSNQELKWLKELFVGQCGITDVEEWDGQQIAYNLDRFRSFGRRLDYSLAESHLNSFGVEADLALPWLDRSKFNPKHVADIIVGRSCRYDGPLRWQELKEYEGRVAFIGLDDEWEKFTSMTGMKVPIYRPESYVDICNVLLGCKLFIGNQSFVFALAEALKINRVQEATLMWPNCLPRSSNGHIILTRDLLRFYLRGVGVEPSGFQRVRPLFCVRNRFSGTTLPRPRLTEPIAGRSLISCLVVTDKDAVPDGIARGLATMPHGETIIVGKSKGYQAINEAAAKTSGDFICVLEENVELVGVWFKEMIGMMNSPLVGAVGQRLVVDPVQHLSSGAVLIQRRAWQECGLFLSDKDKWIGFANRLRAHGYVLRQVRSTSIKEVAP